MSNSNLRNAQLLQQMARHPLKAHLARAFDIAETFAGDVEFLQLDKNLSDAGRQNAMQSKLRAAIRDLRDSRGPIAELQTKLDQKRKAVAMPKFDRSDDYALKLRMELRQTLKTADPGQRALLLEKSTYADALLETEPEASGLFLAEDFKGIIPRKYSGTATSSPRRKKKDWPACSVGSSQKSKNSKRSSPKQT
jgi:hypothetical protein